MSQQLIECLTGRGESSITHHMRHMEEICKFRVFEVREDCQTKQIQVKNFEETDLSTMRQAVAEDKSIGGFFILRLAYVPLTVSRADGFAIGLRKKCYDELLQLFDVSEIRDLAHTSGMSFDILPRCENGKIIGVCYSAFVSNYIGLYFNYRNSGRAYGIIWYHEGQHDTRRMQVQGNLKMAVERFNFLATDPSYLMFALVVNLTSSINQRLGRVRKEVAGIEAHTGYQDWGDLRLLEGLPSSSIESHLPKYSAELSGSATTLASDRRFIQMAFEMIDAINTCAWLTSTDLVPIMELSLRARMKTDLEMLQRRLRINLVQVEILEARVRGQLSAVHNLIARHEMKLSIGIADDSKILANSMKVLAILTVLFLPATFMASLFSTSMFNWHVSEAESVSSLFWIYWLVTIPLTAVTILAFRWLSGKWSKPVLWQVDRTV